MLWAKECHVSPSKNCHDMRVSADISEERWDLSARSIRKQGPPFRAHTGVKYSCLILWWTAMWLKAWTLNLVFAICYFLHPAPSFLVVGLVFGRAHTGKISCWRGTHTNCFTKFNHSCQLSCSLNALCSQPSSGHFQKSKCWDSLAEVGESKDNSNLLQLGSYIRQFGNHFYNLCWQIRK